VVNYKTVQDKIIWSHPSLDISPDIRWGIQIGTFGFDVYKALKNEL